MTVPAGSPQYSGSERRDAHPAQQLLVSLRGVWLRALPLALRIVWCAGWVLVRSVRCGLLR